MMISLKYFIILLLISSVKCNSYFQNNFPNFVCELNENKCTVKDVTSTENFQDKFNNLSRYDFDYYVDSGDYNCRNYGKSYCHNKKRNEFEFYTEIVFENSKFEKFPPGDNVKLNHIKTFSAVNVGLTEINRDDFKSFKSLEVLDLSNNNLTALGNIMFLNLVSLKRLNLSNNQIENIESSAFDESSKNLSMIDLSHNKLKVIHENILNTVGKSDTVEFYLQFNEIESITKALTSFSYDVRTFSILDMSKNKLKSFAYNCSGIQMLLLDDNILEELSIEACTVEFLNLNKNNFKDIRLPQIPALYISNNDNLRNLSINVENLIDLEMKNLPSKIINYELIQNASKLISFNADNTYIGLPKLDTFSEMTSLNNLNLRSTGLASIDYGLFSQQHNLVNLDISYNNLGQIDLNMLASLKNLESLDISGNNLTKVEHIETIKQILPKLAQMKIEENNWNCSYLAHLLKTLSENSIIVKLPVNPIKETPNVIGIGCTSLAQSKIQLVDVDKANEAMANKLNEIIEQINAEKSKNNNVKFDSDVIKSELLDIQKEMHEIQTKIFKIQLDKQITNLNSTQDTSIIKNMMEQLNNLTLEKQKLANDQLLLKINEFQLRINEVQADFNKKYNDFHVEFAKHNLEHKNQSPESISYAYSRNSNENETTKILLVILITSLVIAFFAYGYSKLKQSLLRRNDMMSVRARSTNTINTTVELPFDDGKSN